MEESGHYYTVYATSLAVGFDEDIAYQHAVLAQMPDEVGFLDAANMHINQCLRMKEFDLNGNERAVAADWRYRIEYVIHSLVDRTSGNRSSGYQRSNTRKLLVSCRPDSLEFGLLLHRIGDTYAHSVMGNEKVMYTTTTSGGTLGLSLEGVKDCLTSDNLGHAKHMHNPDYPFKRTSLFYEYLEDLYNTLRAKVEEKDSLLFRKSKRKALTFGELKSIFFSLLGPHGVASIATKMNLSDQTTQKLFIQGIRRKCEEKMGLKLKAYQPERIDKQTLRQFLDAHPELGEMGINERKIIQAVEDLSHSL